MKLHFTCLEKKCEKKTVFFGKVEVFQEIRTSRKKFLAGLSKTAFNVCRGIFGGILCCEKKFFAINLGPSAKICCQACRNCLQFLPSKNYERKTFSGEILIVYNRLDFERKLKQLQAKKMVSLTKLLYLSRWPFRTVQKNNDHGMFSELPVNKTGNFAKSFQPLLKLLFSFLEKNVREMCFWKN